MSFPANGRRGVVSFAYNNSAFLGTGYDGTWLVFLTGCKCSNDNKYLQG